VLAGKILSQTFRGLHHVPDIKDHNLWAEVDLDVTLSTFDGDHLTSLVIACHNEAVRMEVRASGPYRLKLLFHQRRRWGSISYRHPTMLQAVEEFRQSHSPNGWFSGSSPERYVWGHAVKR